MPSKELSKPVGRTERCVRVLYVEDDPDNRDLLAEFLEANGLEVTAVGTAEAAVTALEGGDFDVVLADLSLPDADGLHVARKAKEKDSALPVVILTGWGQYADEGARRGADLLLSKPVSPLDLLDRLLALAIVRGPGEAP